MATTILLIRHAPHPLVGTILCGRAAGVALDAAGRAQAARLGAALARHPPDALYTSPRERARDTAHAIAESCRIRLLREDAFDEIDFGAWTGRQFEELANDPSWICWNTARGDATAPGGELMRQAQMRAVSGLQRLHADHPGGRIAVVSHAEVIKAMLMWCLGLSLDRYHTFDIDPASVSTVILWERGGKVTGLNQGSVA